MEFGDATDERMVWAGEPLGADDRLEERSVRGLGAEDEDEELDEEDVERDDDEEDDEDEEDELSIVGGDVIGDERLSKRRRLR